MHNERECFLIENNSIFKIIAQYIILNYRRNEHLFLIIQHLSSYMNVITRKTTVKFGQ